MYDCLIIGAGPAGLSAGIYVARSNMKTLIFERENTGGQITKTNIIENYPGTRTDITGVFYIFLIHISRRICSFCNLIDVDTDFLKLDRKSHV